MCWIGRKNTKQIAKRDFYVYKIGVVLDSVSYIDSKGAEHVEEPLNYYWDFEEIPNLDATINWEQRRYELAKELLKILISKPNETCFIEERIAIKRADKLIEILKED